MKYSRLFYEYFMAIIIVVYVMARNANLLKIPKIGRLAYKLTQFGEHVLRASTAQGSSA